ncbi:MAG: nucleoside triphosphate pyrophosphohydrolase [Christensenellales bacterium]|jgi:tetrapyrrole methylase family protein/MazG family protein
MIIVGLGYGDMAFLCEKGVSALKNAARLVLQTGKHPIAKALTDAGILFETLDALYEQSEDFDVLYQGILHFMGDGQDIVLGVIGDGVCGSGITHALQRQGVPFELIPGVSLAQAAAANWRMEDGCVLIAASGLRTLQFCGLPMCITEVDNPLRASEVKLWLMDYYDAETRICVVRYREGAFIKEEIALFELDRLTDYDAFTAVLIPGYELFAHERFGFAQLMQIMEMLRAPKGCPWDREQTHESLKSALIEECYEVLDAIEKQDDDALTEELGDVLLQVAFHAQIAKEQGRFTEQDITSGICSKLISRHPHIFGNESAKDPAQVLRSWERIKRDEKGFQSQSEVLRSVPACFPALMRAFKVQKKAANVGFDWEDVLDAFEKIEEEAGELERALAQNDAQNTREELGDLLFAVVNVARLLKMDPEAVLKEATQKFISRFERMENAAQKQGLTLENMTLQQMDALWERAKRAAEHEDGKFEIKKM